MDADILIEPEARDAQQDRSDPAGRRGRWRAQLIEHAAVFAVGVALMLFLHADNRAASDGEVGLSGHDSFYHTKMAAITWERGLLHEFPWLKFVYFTDEGHAFVSHHYGFHLLLSPFVKVSDWLTGDLRLGAIWAMATFFGLVVLLLDVLLVSQRIRWRWLWLLLILLLPSQLFTRLSYVRAIAPSLVCMLLITCAMVRGRFALTGLAVAIYIHVYLGGVLFGPLLVVLYVLASMVGPAGDREFPWRLIAWSLSGWVVGLATHPYAGGVYEFLLLQVFGSGLSPDISVGREWKPYQDLWWFGQMCGPLFIVWMIAVCLRCRMGPHLSRAEMFFLLAHFVFLTLTMKARRFIEYWPIFALLSAAFLSSPIIGRFTTWFDGRLEPAPDGGLRRWSRGRVLKTCALVVCAASLIIGAAPQWKRTQKTARCGYDLPAIRDAMAFLKQNSAEGDVVFTDDWDIFPVYFYYNSFNHYVVGMDPKFTQNRRPGLWRRYVKISRGQVPAKEEVRRANPDGRTPRGGHAEVETIDVRLEDIRTHFGARFVITDQDHVPLARKLTGAKSFARLVYPGTTLKETKDAPYRIFRILDGSG